VGVGRGLFVCSPFGGKERCSEDAACGRDHVADTHTTMAFAAQRLEISENFIRLSMYGKSVAWTESELDNKWCGFWQSCPNLLSLRDGRDE
jgi:hypothetical protein